MSGTTPLVLLYAIADSVKSLIAYGKCEQTNLPGYTELEYIESTGTQYIDNVYTFQSNIYNIEITAETSVTGREICVCSLLGAGTALIELAWSSTQGRIFSYQTTAGGSLGYNNLANIYNNKTFINIWQDSTKRYLKVNNEAAISDNNALSMPTSNAVKLLGMNSAVYNFVGKLYSCKITDNNVLVRNLIPVRRNSDNAVGMYDTVSGTFFINQGAGTFTAGAEKTPTPDNPIPIVCNNGELKTLPAEYQAVEYLESTGTQYINVNYTMTSDIAEYGIKFYGSPNLSSSLFGSETSSGFARYTGVPYTNQSGTKVYLGKQEVANTDIRFPADQWNNYTIKINSDISGSLQLNNTTINFTYSNGIQKQLPIYLFANNKSEAIQFLIGKVASFYIKDNNVLVRNLIPARRNSDNAIGMYDTVTDTFFTNAGTGTFTAGPDVSPVYAEGTTETIEVHGVNQWDEQWEAGTFDTTTGASISESAQIRAKNLIPILPETQYYFCIPSGSCWVIFYDAERNVVTNYSPTGYLSSSGNSYRYANNVCTTPKTARYCKFYMTALYGRTYNNDISINYPATNTAYEPYFNGGTATCENLLSVGNYEDEQEVISGAVTRKVGVKVLDGTENWLKSSSNAFYLSYVIIDYPGTRFIPFCTHFKGQLSTTIGSTQVQDLCVCFFAGTGLTKEFYIRYNAITTVEQFKQWLADQYSAGTPVIIVYPLGTPTTETVSGQNLTLQEGTNILEITQASLPNLELEAEYLASQTP
jgi:hypothetical protein